MIEWIEAKAIFLASIVANVGHECPKCKERRWMTHQDLGHTLHGQNFRVRCGACGGVFKVPYDRDAKLP